MMINLGDLPPDHLAHGHISLLWNAPRITFARQIRELQQHAQLITLTEMGDDWKVNFVRNLPGWGAAAYTDGAMGECATLWDRDILRHRAHRVHPLTHLRVRTDTGVLRDPVHMLKTVLEHRHTGRNLVSSVFHQVSGIEGDIRTHLRRGELMDLRTPDDASHRLAVAMSVLRNVHARNEIIRTNRPRAAKLQTADWNVNLELEPMRELVERATGMNFPEARWARRVDGTHGTRTIDGTVVEKCRIVTVDDFPTDASDHDGFIEIVDMGAAA